MSQSCVNTHRYLDKIKDKIRGCHSLNYRFILNTPLRSNTSSFESFHPDRIVVVVAVSDVQTKVEKHHENGSGNHGKGRVFHFKFEAQQFKSFVARSIQRFVFHILIVFRFIPENKR